MPKGTLQWAETSPPVEVTTRADLESRLRSLSEQSAALPTLATLVMADGGSSHIGLGREESILIVHGPTHREGWTEEWISIGQEERQGYTEFFLLGEHHSEFENRSLLPVNDAIRAIGELFENGSRPKWIRWETNTF